MSDVVALCVACLGALVPTLIFVFINYTMDRYEREPLWLASLVFVWGAIPAIIVSIIFSLLLEIPLTAAVGSDEVIVDLAGAAVIAPVVEEIAKALPLLGIFYFFKREFDGLMDGLIYGSLVGFGFAMTENVLYFLSAYAEGGFVGLVILIFLRAIIFGLNHALFTSATGVGLGFARYSTNSLTRSIAPIVGLGVAILLHAAHNFFASVGGGGVFLSFLSDYIGIAFWLVLAFFALRQERKWIAEELQFEVASGLLPAEHAKAAASYTDRMRDRARLARERGSSHAKALDRLHHVATDLAFKKRQLSIHGEEKGNSAEVDRLRGEITQLLAQI